MAVKDSNHRITVNITEAEFQRIRLATETAKKNGRKMTISKYVAGVLRSHWETEQLFMGHNGSEP